MPSLFRIWMALGLAHAPEPSTQQRKVLSAPNLALGDLVGRLAELEERVALLEKTAKLT